MSKVLLSTLVAVICFTAAVLGGIVVLQYQQPQYPTLGSAEQAFTSFSTSSVETVTTTSARVVATSTSRRHLVLQNLGSGVAYCQFGGKVAADQQGFLLLASSTTYIPQGSEAPYAGAIACISSSTIKLLVNELD
jgi:hypothetical protein